MLVTLDSVKDSDNSLNLFDFRTNLIDITSDKMLFSSLCYSKLINHVPVLWKL